MLNNQVKNAYQEIVRMDNICMSNILDNARIHVFQGEIVGLLGLNYSGKSALMKVLAGYSSCDNGNIYFEESPVSFSSPMQAIAHGIHYFFSEKALLHSFDVAENIFVMRHRHPMNLLSHKKMVVKANEILRFLDSDISAETIVSELSLLQKIIVLLAKAVSQNAKLILIDHLLSVLSESELWELKKTLARITEQGASVILVDYRASSLIPICNRIFILREGQTAGSYSEDDYDEKTLNAIMIGYRIDVKKHKAATYPIHNKIFEFKDVLMGSFPESLSFCVHQNEIVGLCCLNKNFNVQFVNTVLGQLEIKSGQIFVGESPVEISQPRDALDAGIGVISGSNEVFTNLSVFDNITISSVKQNSSVLGTLKKSSELFAFNEALYSINDNKMLFMKNASPSFQNKLFERQLSICRNLTINPKLMIYVNPYSGMDIISTNQMNSLIVSLTNKNRSAIVISTNIHELLSTCDNIIFIHNGKVIQSIKTNSSSYDTILDYYNFFCSI